MHRTNRNNAVCFKSLEQALAESPETYGYIDLFAFGFPCQDISQANSSAKGIEGSRSFVFFECMRVVDIFKPKWLLIENVPRLLSINKGKDFAIVLQTLSKSGYGFAWRVLDSQYFGLAQRRKRLFIVGCLGRIPPPEILFEQESSSRDNKKKQKMGKRGLYVSQTINTRTGERNNINETIIAQCLSTHNFAGSISSPGRTRNIAARTIGAAAGRNTSFIRQDTHIAKTNTGRKRTIAGISKRMDSRRGIVIGNAVSVNVVEWIGKRINKAEKEITNQQ